MGNVNGSSLYIFDCTTGAVRCCLTGHAAEILAVDAQDVDIIATLSSDAVLKLWSGMTGKCVQTFQVPEASFFLGYACSICMCDNRIVVSADQGVYLVEFDASWNEV